MFRVTTRAFITWKGKLTASCIDDDRLFLRRMPNEYCDVVISEACVAIDGKSMPG